MRKIHKIQPHFRYAAYTLVTFLRCPKRKTPGAGLPGRVSCLCRVVLGSAP